MIKETIAAKRISPPIAPPTEGPTGVFRCGDGAIFAVSVELVCGVEIEDNLIISSQVVIVDL